MGLGKGIFGAALGKFRRDFMQKWGEVEKSLVDGINSELEKIQSGGIRLGAYFFRLTGSRFYETILVKIFREYIIHCRPVMCEIGYINVDTYHMCLTELSVSTQYDELSLEIFDVINTFLAGLNEVK